MIKRLVYFLILSAHLSAEIPAVKPAQQELNARLERLKGRRGVEVDEQQVVLENFDKTMALSLIGMGIGGMLAGEIIIQNTRNIPEKVRIELLAFGVEVGSLCVFALGLAKGITKQIACSLNKEGLTIPGVKGAESNTELLVKWQEIASIESRSLETTVVGYGRFHTEYIEVYDTFGRMVFSTANRLITLWAREFKGLLDTFKKVYGNTSSHEKIID